MKSIGNKSVNNESIDNKSINNKDLRKYTALFIALVLVMSMLTACGGSALTAGYYKLTELNTGEEVIGADTLSILGDSSYIVLESGGSGYFTMFGTAEDLTYTESTVTISGETMKATLSGNKLVLVDSSDASASMTFTKSDEEPPAKPEDSQEGEDEDGSSSGETEADHA